MAIMQSDEKKSSAQLVGPRRTIADHYIARTLIEAQTSCCRCRSRGYQDARRVIKGTKRTHRYFYTCKKIGMGTTRSTQKPQLPTQQVQWQTWHRRTKTYSLSMYMVEILLSQHVPQSEAPSISSICPRMYQAQKKRSSHAHHTSNRTQAKKKRHPLCGNF